MAILGWIFLAFITLIVGLGLILGITSLPDARRYLKLRRM
ncbi:DUF6893 family small protein [Mycobacterium sp.]